MTRKRPKYKLLLDENFIPRIKLTRTNNRHDLKHIKHDYKLLGLSDERVYKLALEEKRIVVTFNDKDFKERAQKSKDSGVIGISAHMSDEQIDKKLAALLNKAKPKDLYGKFRYISGETDIKDIISS